MGVTLLLFLTVCGPSSPPPGNTGVSGREPSGGGGVGLPDASVKRGSVPDGSTGAPVACYLCGASAGLDAGCPTSWTANQVVTETGTVCVCENASGAYGCQFCSPSNPTNGGCDAGTGCVQVCAPGGDFYLCIQTGTTVPDQCYPPDAG